MIELAQVTKTYPDSQPSLPALRDISLQVKSGQICGVVGKSGAGKSTLLRCVNLLERPTRGAVRVAGLELTTLSEPDLRRARRKISMIFQHFNLLSSLSVYDNVALPLRLLGAKASVAKNKVLPLLELTGLAHKRAAYPAQLSGGQKQRVAIARALAAEPKVLLCDEATSALDHETTQAILELLKNINQQFGLTILLITHEMEVIKEIADQVVILDHGQIIENAPIMQLFTQPQSALAQNFVKSCLRQELPQALQQRLFAEASVHTKPLLRIYFQRGAAEEPVVFHLIQHVGLEINILQANIEFIKGQPMGIMVVEVMNSETNKLQQAMAFLREKGLSVEVVGYV